VTITVRPDMSGRSAAVHFDMKLSSIRDRREPQGPGPVVRRRGGGHE
jgi:hypothetical protein